MKTCNICNKTQGELVGRERIVIDEADVCNTCARELKKLEEVYRQDFLERTEEEFDIIIPWPAFKMFTWPPNALVLVSAWAVNRKEFAVGMSQKYLIAGRRSFASIEKEIISRIAELTKKMEEAKDVSEKKTIEKDLHELELKSKKLTSMKVQGERRLVSIPLDRVTIESVNSRHGWTAVQFDHLEMVPRAFRSEKEETKREQWEVSNLYADAIKKLEDRIKAAQATNSK